MKYADLSTILTKEIRKYIDPQFADLVDCGWAPNERGDFSSSVSLKIAKQMKKSPLEVAKDIVQHLESNASVTKYIDRVEAKAPGFVNFWVKPEFFSSAVGHIIKEGNHFGRAKKKKEKILLEFLSANPTGPMHLGNGRGGFTGDCLANVLDWAGYHVKREYYINNVGNQIVRLGKSVLHAAGFLQENSDDLYSALYISDLVKELHPTKDDKAEEVGKRAARILLHDIQRVVEERMHIHFDRWFPEDHLYVASKTEKILQWIQKEKLAYEKDGALWFASSQFGDDKDRVLVKSDGEKTYMLSDIAYHKDKFDRGFDKLIDIFGADHHGYIGRTFAAVEALGYKKEQLDILIVQLVRLIENGKEVKMSKRSGTFVTIEELIDEVGHDVVRFFFLMRAPETHMDFDLNLAKEHSNKNPVYYVQYAHARIHSILEKARTLTVVAHKTPLEESEKNLVKELMKFPQLVESVANTYAVHQFPSYAVSLADAFHRFYEHCRVIDNDTVNENRLKMVQATQIVLKNALSVIGVSAPEKM